MATKRKTKGEPSEYRTREPKLCVECKWFQPDSRMNFHRCGHRLGHHISGTSRYTTDDMRRDRDAMYNAHLEQMKKPGFYPVPPLFVYSGDGQCGPEGRLWEPKPEPVLQVSPIFQVHEPIKPGSFVRVGGATGWKVPRRWWRFWQ